MRWFVRLCSSSGLMLAALFCVAAGSSPGRTAYAQGAADAERANVLLFLVDDMGWMDSGAYGSRYYETPNIDKLASRGVLFTDAYSANPLCSPTRASILTGKYPARLGITSAVGHRPPRPEGSPRYPEKAPPTRPILTPESLHYLRPAEYTLAEALRDAGYRTGHFGKWHLGLTEPYWPERQGFDVAWHGKPDPGPPGPNGYFSPYSFAAGTVTPGPPGEYIVDRVTDEAIRFIEASKGRPFFASDPQVAMLLGWVPKFCTTAVKGEALEVAGKGRKPFIATVRIRARGPLELRARLRSASDGEGLVQWRTADQKTFPPKEQTTAYKLQAGDWRDVRVPLAEDREVIHLRFYLPAEEKPVEIDWVELWQPDAAAPVGRWDFRQTK